MDELHEHVHDARLPLGDALGEGGDVSGRGGRSADDGAMDDGAIEEERTTEANASSTGRPAGRAHHGPKDVDHYRGVARHLSLRGPDLRVRGRRGRGGGRDDRLAHRHDARGDARGAGGL